MRMTKLLLVPGSMLVAGLANAAATPVDVSAVTDQIASAATPIGLIGVAVLVVVAILATYKWIKRAA